MHRSASSKVVNMFSSVSVTAVLVLGTVVSWAAPARAVDRYVTESGLDVGACSSVLSPCATVGYGMNQAGDGDTVKVARGTYPGNNEFTHRTQATRLLVQGGWAEDFSSRSHDPSLTAIDGKAAGRLFAFFRDDEDPVPRPSPDTDVTIQGFTLTHGGGEFNGGALYVDTWHESVVSVTLRNNLIRGNSASRGAGVYASAMSGGTTTVTLENNTITSNSANAGAALYGFTDNSTLVVNSRGNMIYGNGGGDRGSAIGIENESFTDSASATVTLVNDTITENSGGVVTVLDVMGRISVSVTNSIVWGNGERNIVNTLFCGTCDFTFNIDHSIVETSGVDDDVVFGEGVIATDPLFADPARNDFHLGSDSPAVDRGVCGRYVFSLLDPADRVYRRIAPEEDFEGDSFPADGETEGCDIGADELLLPLPVPDGANVFPYEVPEKPVRGNGPAACEPVAVGDLSTGMLNLRAGLPESESSVDIYLGISAAPIDPENIFLITAEGEIQSLADGLAPWKANITENFDETFLGAIPLADLPSGIYEFYLLATPAGAGGFDDFYFWTTGLMVP